METNRFTDLEIIKQVQSGQRDLFGVLVERYYARIRAMVAHYVVNRDDAYDIMQDVFLEAYHHIDRFETDRDFLPWLRSLCRHRILNYFRERKTHYAAIQTLIHQTVERELTGPAARDDIFEQRIMALRHCTEKLEKKHQHLIELRYQMRVAVKDIAQRLDLSAANVSMRLNRIRTLLARCMERKLNHMEGGTL